MALGPLKQRRQLLCVAVLLRQLMKVKRSGPCTMALGRGQRLDPTKHNTEDNGTHCHGLRPCPALASSCRSTGPCPTATPPQPAQMPWALKCHYGELTRRASGLRIWSILKAVATKAHRRINILPKDVVLSLQWWIGPLSLWMGCAGSSDPPWPPLYTCAPLATLLAHTLRADQYLAVLRDPIGRAYRRSALGYADS